MKPLDVSRKREESYTHFEAPTRCPHKGKAMPAISEKIVEGLPIPPAGNKVHFFSGATLQGKKAPAGFGVRCTAAGTKSFVLFHRADGRKYLETLGRWDANAQGGTLSVRDAIVKADGLAKDLAKGRREDPRPARTRRLQDGDRVAGETVSGLLDKFVERYVKKEAKLRTADQIEATFDRLVKPKIGKLGIYDLRRSNVVNMLDEIDDENGPVMADRVLALVRKAFNWHATRDDDFRPPIVKGMARTKPKERAAKRTLADDEIRDLWSALATVKDVPDCYPAFVKTLLLTATRRNEAADMHTSELDGDVWLIPGARYKTKLDHVVPLSAMAREAISEVPKKASFVFSSTSGTKAFSGFSKSKIELDKVISDIRAKDGREPIANWTLHDLRRTARSLMSRARVPTDHAERALGHVMGGVRETYDRYEYLEEKRQAFDALAALISRILNPTANVEELASRSVVQS
jgi:integrase